MAMYSHTFSSKQIPKDGEHYLFLEGNVSIVLLVSGVTFSQEHHLLAKVTHSLNLELG